MTLPSCCAQLKTVYINSRNSWSGMMRVLAAESQAAFMDRTPGRQSMGEWFYTCDSQFHLQFHTFVLNVRKVCFMYWQTSSFCHYFAEYYRRSRGISGSELYRLIVCAWHWGLSWISHNNLRMRAHNRIRQLVHLTNVFCNGVDRTFVSLREQGRCKSIVTSCALHHCQAGLPSSTIA